MRLVSRDEGPEGEREGFSCEVALTDEAFYSYAAIPSEKAFARVGQDIGLLEHTPYLGRVYDPAYDASRPPFPCRVLYCGHYGIYYRVDEDAERVTVFAVVDQRRDLERRFASREYGIIDF